MAEVPDEQQHAQYLANKIMSLGGEPIIMTPRPVPSARTNREMLEAVLAAELLGEKGQQVQFEDMVRDESGHAEEPKRIWRECPL